jgi:hypothetical protein
MFSTFVKRVKSLIEIKILSKNKSQLILSFVATIFSLFLGFFFWNLISNEDLNLIIKFEERPDSISNVRVYSSAENGSLVESAKSLTSHSDGQIVFEIPKESNQIKVQIGDKNGLYRLTEFKLTDKNKSTVFDWIYREPALPGCEQSLQIENKFLSTNGIIINSNDRFPSFVCKNIQEKISKSYQTSKGFGMVFFFLSILSALLFLVNPDSKFKNYVYSITALLSSIEIFGITGSLYLSLSGSLHNGINDKRNRAFYELSLEELEMEKTRAIHPYVGFIRNRDRKKSIYGGNTSSDQVNILGMTTNVDLFEKRASQVFVGVTGGSVAQQLVRFSSDELRQKLQQVKNWKDKEIVIIPLALSGFKQPQQLMLFTYLSTLDIKFDLLINLDGFNEVALTFAENRAAGIHFSYPRGWQHLVGSEKSPKYITQLYLLSTLLNTRQKAIKFFNLNYINISHFMNLVWYLIDNQLGYLQARTKLQIYNSNDKTSFEKTGPQLNRESDMDFINRSAQLWFESSKILSKICNGLNVPYFHFLQPNQYNPSIKKKFSQQELTNAINEKQPYRRGVVLGYRKLEEFGIQLRIEKVNFFSLGSIYDSIDTTVFKDDCCHLNPTGNSILVDAIGKKIVSHLNR